MPAAYLTRWVFQVPSLAAAILKLLVDTADAEVVWVRNWRVVLLVTYLRLPVRLDTNG